MVNLKNQKEA
jgi:hypothetical protein